MRLFWRTRALTVTLAIVGTPLTAQALSLPDYIAQKNFQLAQFEQKGGERQGRVRSGGNVRNPAANRADREGISRNRKPYVAGWSGGDRRRGVRHSWGPGAQFFFYDGHYHGDCAWLRRKANATGSRSWWHRYHQCRQLD